MSGSDIRYVIYAMNAAADAKAKRKNKSGRCRILCVAHSAGVASAENHSLDVHI